MAKKSETSIVPLDIDAATLTGVMQREIETRKVITAYIAHNMKKGVDYGSIEVTGKSGARFKSKPSLFKPGSEKFLSLFKLQARFKKDTDTWEMAGSYPNTFTYLCELITLKGVKVGEGRGASRLDEKIGWTVNNAIKIAQKRAQIDAVLRTGALSDFFTQDFEEEAESGKLAKTYKVERVAPADDDEGQGKRKAPDDATQKKMEIAKLLKSKFNYIVLGKKQEDVTQKVKDMTGMALEESNYEKILDRLKGIPAPKPEV